MRLHMELNFLNDNMNKNLILIHGWGINSVVFNNIATQLMDTANVCCLDLPGYGKNHSLDYSYDDYPEFMEKLHQSLPKHCFVLGWSLGGLIALDYACRYQNDVSGLITVCSSPRFTELLDEDDEQHQIWNGVNERTLKAFTRLLKPVNKDQVCDHFLALQAMGSPSIRQDIKSLRKALKDQVKPTYESLIMGLKLLSFLDLRDSCIKLEIPMLHCFGKYDRLVPTEDLVKYWYDNPQAKTKVFTKTSHNPFLSESSDFIETVKSFINSVSN